MFSLIFVEMKQGVVDEDAFKMPAPADKEKGVQVNATKRRHRTILNQFQKDVLTAAFLKDPYPRDDIKEVLAKQIGLTRTIVHTWFQNRRSKIQRKAEDSNMMRRFKHESVNRDMNWMNIFGPFHLPLLPQQPPVIKPHINPLCNPGAMPGVPGALLQRLMVPPRHIPHIPPPMLHPKHFGLPPLPFPLPTPSIDMSILHTGDGCTSEPPKPQ